MRALARLFAPLVPLLLHGPAQGQGLRVEVDAVYLSVSGPTAPHLANIVPGLTTFEVRTVVPEPATSPSTTTAIYALDVNRTTFLHSGNGPFPGNPAFPSSDLVVTDEPAGDALRFSCAVDLGVAHTPPLTTRIDVDLAGPTNWFTSTDLRSMTGTLIDLSNDPGARVTVTYSSFQPTDFVAIAQVTELRILSVPAEPVGPLCLADDSPSAASLTVPCPCGNEAAPGSGEGCRNSTGRGAILTLRGSPSLAASDLAFTVRHAPPRRTGVLIQCTEVYPFAFRDGLQCVTGPARLLEYLNFDDAGFAATTVPIAASGHVPAPGVFRVYQVMYRDSAASVCGTGSNFTTAYGVRFE